MKTDNQKLSPKIPGAPAQPNDVPQGVLIATGAQRVEFTSPLPPAEFINDYARITPEAPQLLLNLFVRQVEHRIDCENRDLNARIALHFRGQWFGFVFAICALVAGGVAIVFRQPWVASCIFLTTIPFCAVVFILRKEPKESKRTTAIQKNNTQRPMPNPNVRSPKAQD